MGYPTQKPLKLLERIIEASTDKGDWVLDPFCGCGTAVIASEKLHRHWVGMDITYLAINLIRNRLKDSFPTIRFKIEGEPQDLSGAVALAKADRYQFQWWAVSLIGARPYGSTDAEPQKGKKGADEGVDGWLKFQDGKEGNIEAVLVQVKSGNVEAKDIRELRDRLTAKHAAIGVFITLERPTSDMIKEMRATDPYVSPRWKQEYPRIQIITVESLLKGHRPLLPPTVNLFTEAKGQKYARTPTEDLDKWTDED
jgi:site-specific DNA-methyltransferase (adenine-specific)